MKKREGKFVTHIAENGLPYYTVVGGNGEVLHTSQTFKSGTQGMMKTINGLAGTMYPTKIVHKEKKKNK